MDLILYHAKCTDGFCAAYVAAKKYHGATLVPCQFSTEPPFELVEGKDVLVVDFSWKSRADNIKLNLLAKSFRILDHHISSKALLEGLDFATFDESRSGAGLAWDYLFGKDSGVVASVWEGNKTYAARPWYVNYVEDYDTWQHKLPRTREINAYLHLIPKTIEAWDGVAELDPTMAVRFGVGALMQINANADKLVEASNPGLGWGCTIGVVNAPTFQASEVGERLAEKYDVGLIWWERQDGIVSFSLRSKQPGDIDVSKIATRMGGGGHKHSAGFEVKNLSEANSLLGDILNRRPKEYQFPCNLK